MPVVTVQRLTDREDGAKKLMVFCAGRGGRHPIHICQRYCRYYQGLEIGGVKCDWHTSDGPLTFKTPDDRLPAPGDTSIISDLFDVPGEAGSTLV